MARTYGVITFSSSVKRKGRPAMTVISYNLDRVKVDSNAPHLPELNFLHIMVNNSPGFLLDMKEKGDALLDKLLLVKVVYCSETVNRTKATITSGTKLKFPFVRVSMEDGDSSIAYAQVRGIFKAIYTTQAKSDLVFLVRYVITVTYVTIRHIR
jgi:hypothetical protein